MSLEVFRAALAALGAGTTEIYFHPGAERDPPDPAALARTVASNQ
jgi:hypothetical protein